MIVGQTVRLCPFDVRHKARTRDWANDPEISRLMDRARPVSELEHECWCSALHERSDILYSAIETICDNRHIGNVWLCNIDPRHRKAEVRIVIGEVLGRDCGMGTEAIRLISEFAFTRLNLHKVYAYVLSLNPRALRSFQKAGFVVEGTLRNDRWAENQYVDVHLLGKFNENAAET